MGSVVWGFCRRSRSDVSGQDLIEYGLLAMFISVTAYLTVSAIGGDVVTIFNLVPPATSAAAGS
jgi:Flp pilus assembly pilin Flp